MTEPEKRVAVISPDGQFGTISAKHAEAVVRAGGRVLTKQEVAQQEAEEAYAKKSTGEKVAQALAGHGIGPASEAFLSGAKSGATAGLYQGAMRQGLQALGGQAAGDAYAQHEDTIREASPVAHTAGEVAGMFGGAAIGSAVGPAAAALPGAGISMAGEALGGAIGEGLAGVAARGALQRAGVAALKMGAQGVLEGGAYSATQAAGDALLHDTPVATDKLFAQTGAGALWGGLGGAALGGTGSLVASGARSAAGGLARALSKPAEAIADAGERATGAIGDEVVKAASAPEGLSLRGVAKDLTTEAGTKGLAYDRAWASLGGGFGLQSTAFAKRAQKYLPNQTRDVGEWLMRKGVLNPEGGIVDTARAATPEKMLPQIRAAVEADGRRIGELTGASGGLVQAADIMKAIDNVAVDLESAGATRHVGRSVRELGNEILDSLGANNGNESFAVQDVLRERRALDDVLFDTNRVNPKLAQRVKEQLRGNLEGLVVNALDDASGRLKGELATEYKALKRDYLAGNIALDVAEDSSTRAAKAGFLGLKDLTYGGGSLLKSVASKLGRERGDAVAATQLYQMAEKGTLTKWIQKMDDQIGKASKGLLQPPAKGLPKPADRMPATKALAKTALAKVAEFKADPEGYIDRATRQTESVGTHSPDLAQSLVARHVQAMSFLASKVPQVPDPDPLDPHPAPKMTANEEAELGRYAWYVEKPSRFFAEVARGKVTFEGAEVAQALAPNAFHELQQATIVAISDHMAKGNYLPYRQRHLLGVLMDVAATPSQRPDHAAFLQKNVSMLDSEPTAPAPKRSAPPVPGTQHSALDRLEASGPGRH